MTWQSVSVSHPSARLSITLVSQHPRVELLQATPEKTHTPVRLGNLDTAIPIPFRCQTPLRIMFLNPDIPTFPKHPPDRRTTANGTLRSVDTIFTQSHLFNSTLCGFIKFI
ncbi:UNVERIFIED_CONTAM: hypothetical protein FKN15_004287 [Acipenser sinensis]